MGCVGYESCDFDVMSCSWNATHSDGNFVLVNGNFGLDVIWSFFQKYSKEQKQQKQQGKGSKGSKSARVHVAVENPVTPNSMPTIPMTTLLGALVVALLLINICVMCAKRWRSRKTVYRKVQFVDDSE